MLANIFEKQKLNFYLSALFHMKTRVSLKYFVNDCKCLAILVQKSLREQKEKHDCVKAVQRIQDFNWTMAKLKIYIEHALEEDECSKLKNLI